MDVRRPARLVAEYCGGDDSDTEMSLEPQSDKKRALPSVMSPDGPPPELSLPLPLFNLEHDGSDTKDGKTNSTSNNNHGSTASKQRSAGNNSRYMDTTSPPAFSKKATGLTPTLRKTKLSTRARKSDRDPSNKSSGKTRTRTLSPASARLLKVQPKVPLHLLSRCAYCVS